MDTQTAEKIKQFEGEFRELLQKHQIEMDATLDFPVYKQNPVEVELALAVIRKYGGVIKTMYKIKEEKKPTE